MARLNISNLQQKSSRNEIDSCNYAHVYQEACVFTSQRFKIDPREWLAVTNDWYDDKVLLMATVD